MDSHGPDDKPAKKVKLATASAVDEDEEESDWEDLDGMYTIDLFPFLSSMSRL